MYKREFLLKFAIIAFFLLALGYWSVGLYFFPNNGMLQWQLDNAENVTVHSGSDAEPVWQRNASLFNGQDPYKFMTGQEAPVAPNIGEQNKFMATDMPWGSFLSQIILPGFLPFQAAACWGLFLSLCIYCIVAIIIYRLTFKIATAHTIQYNTIQQIALLTVAITLAQFGFAPGLKWLNPGIHLTGLIIISALLDEKKQGILIGILLGFAMIRPQVALLFFIPHLIGKNYKVLIAGGLTVIIPWIANAILFSQNPITQLLDYYNLSTSTAIMQEHLYLGFFDAFFKYFKLSSLLVLQMAICFVFCVILCYKFRKAPNYLLFSIPAVFSTFWTYTNYVNIPVITLLIISIVLYLAESNFSLKKFNNIFLFFAIIVIVAPFSSSLYLYYSPIFAPLFQKCIFIFALSIVLKFNYRLS